MLAQANSDGLSYSTQCDTGLSNSERKGSAATVAGYESIADSEGIRIRSCSYAAPLVDGEDLIILSRTCESGKEVTNNVHDLVRICSNPKV